MADAGGSDPLRSFITKEFVMTLMNLYPQFGPQIQSWIQQCGVSARCAAAAAVGAVAGRRVCFCRASLLSLSPCS